jgi:hypothetical protein
MRTFLQVFLRKPQAGGRQIPYRLRQGYLRGRSTVASAEQRVLGGVLTCKMHRTRGRWQRTIDAELAIIGLSGHRQGRQHRSRR